MASADGVPPLPARITKGDLIVEGKTKKVFAVVESPHYAILSNKSDITAHDDPNFTQSFQSKAISATTTTCNVFRLLKEAAIPVAFEQRLNDTEFLGGRSEMLPLEIVARRMAVGSFLKRHPEKTPVDAKKPHRFHSLKTEFFLKTTSGGKFNGKTYPTDDPLLLNTNTDTWTVVHPKQPLIVEGSVFGTVEKTEVLNPGVTKLTIPQLDALVRRVFLVLEKAWAQQGFTLIDLKIEVDSLGRVSDVVDSDSWRLWKNGEAFDKQLFRDGGQGVLSEVEQKYAYIAGLSSNLTIPKQVVLVVGGRGVDDVCKEVRRQAINVELQAWHSSVGAAVRSLNQYERLISEYPQGGVVIAIDRDSDALGCLFASHSAFPVVAVRTSPHQYESVGGEAVPLSIANDPETAVAVALRILAQTNPALYSVVQVKLEHHDIYE